MHKKKIVLYIICCLNLNFCFSQKLLIPMDQSQTDHLKAYGVAFLSLKKGDNVDWLLNFRGGSFIINYNSSIEIELKLRNIYYEIINLP